MRALNYLPPFHDIVAYPPNMNLLVFSTLTKVIVGTLSSHLEWNSLALQPSLVARQQTLQFPVFGNHSPSFFEKFFDSDDRMFESIT